VSLPLGVARARLVTTDQVIGVLSAERERDQIQAFLSIIFTNNFIQLLTLQKTTIAFAVNCGTGLGINLIFFEC
jgi:hypothetical protein